jgi:hypothetical protein
MSSTSSLNWYRSLLFFRDGVALHILRCVESVLAMFWCTNCVLWFNLRYTIYYRENVFWVLSYLSISTCRSRKCLLGHVPFIIGTDEALLTGSKLKSPSVLRFTRCRLLYSNLNNVTIHSLGRRDVSCKKYFVISCISCDMLRDVKYRSKYMF